MSWFIYSIAALVLLLTVLYTVSTICHYYIRISFFYFCIFLHGIECAITLIPSFLRNEGADLVFHKFYYWCQWTGVRVQVRDFMNADRINGPAVVIANHQSAIDVIIMSNVWPNRTVVMMKKILMYIPFFNLAAYWANTIFVDRKNRQSAMQSVDYCVEQLKKRDLKLWIFPEGTRNREGGMLPFKKGAFNIAVRAQMPIIPIVVSDYRPFYSKDKKYFYNDGEVIAKVLPPIITKGLTLDDVNELATTTREKMLETYELISEEAKQLVDAKRTKKE